MDNLGEMDTFLGTHNLQRLNHDKIEYLNISVTKEIESVVKKLPGNKRTRKDTGEFYHTFQEEVIPVLRKLIQKTAEKRTLPIHFMRPVIP